jgi:hypothetical protein
MCGSATTALAARGLGFDVSASDIMYPATIIARAKLFRLNDGNLKELIAFPSEVELSRGRTPRVRWRNWTLWYHPKVLRNLEDIVEGIATVRSKPFAPHLLTAFFQTAWDVSAADKRVAVPTRSRYSRSPPKLSTKSVMKVFGERLRRIVRAQRALRDLFFSTTPPHIRQANALSENDWPTDPIQIILTSPPYGCGVDYGRAFRLQMRFTQQFAPRSYSKSTFVGRASELIADSEVLPSSESKTGWLRQIYRRPNEESAHRLEMFFQYLQDMRTFARISRRRLVNKGMLCLVVGNPQIARRPVPLTRILRKIVEEEGFVLESEQRDSIRNRLQNFELRSATSHISQEYLLSFKLI